LALEDGPPVGLGEPVLVQGRLRWRGDGDSVHGWAVSHAWLTAVLPPFLERADAFSNEVAGLLVALIEVRASRISDRRALFDGLGTRGGDGSVNALCRLAHAVLAAAHAMRRVESTEQFRNHFALRLHSCGSRVIFHHRQ